MIFDLYPLRIETIDIAMLINLINRSGFSIREVIMVQF